VTPSVAAPGVIHPSDATERTVCLIVISLQFTISLQGAIKTLSTNKSTQKCNLYFCLCCNLITSYRRT